MKVLYLGLVLLGSLLLVQGQGEVVCYWGTWSHYRQGDGQFRVEDIDGSHCTIIMYAFFGIGADASIRILDSWLDIDLQNIEKTVALKQRWPHLKVLPSIGGWNEGSGTFSQVAKDAGLRARFADNALAFVRQWGFDGFDVDWEYPGQREGSDPSVDKGNFVLMMQELSNKLKPNGLLLTIASGASNAAVDISYDLPALNNYLDYILVMTYDLWGSWESTTGHNAALTPRPGLELLNVDNCIKYYVSNGFPARKLILGIPLYGRTFTITPGNNGVGAPSSGPGTPGPHSQTAGWLNYNEICLRGGYTREWDGAAQVPYLHNGDQWITYDDVESIRLKAGYAASNGMGGTMVWALEADDFRGLCGGGAFTLLRAARP